MPPIVRILAGLLVICAGASVAMLFRTEAPPVTAVGLATGGLPAGAEAPRIVTGSTRLAKAPTHVGQYPTDARSFDVAENVAADPFRRRELMPRLPAESPLGAGALSSPGTADFRDEPDTTPPLPPTADGSRQHRVADGDTLSKLAARYLGDPRRYLEVYELNRDVLPSPNALPIGTLLRIPRRDDPPPPINPNRLQPLGE